MYIFLKSPVDVVFLVMMSTAVLGYESVLTNETQRFAELGYSAVPNWNPSAEYKCDEEQYASLDLKQDKKTVCRITALFIQRRAIKRIFLIEKSFYANDYVSFEPALLMTESERKGMDTLNAIAQRNVKRGVRAIVLRSLSRLIEEEKLPQHSWITESVIRRCFGYAIDPHEVQTAPLPYQRIAVTEKVGVTVSSEDDRIIRQFETYIRMMILAIKVQKFRKAHGFLPDELKSLNVSDDICLDAWAYPIRYTSDQGKWFFVSLNYKGEDFHFSIDGYEPILVPVLRNMVYCEGFSQKKKELFESGEVKGKIWVRLNQKGLHVITQHEKHPNADNSKKE